MFSVVFEFSCFQVVDAKFWGLQMQNLCVEFTEKTFSVVFFLKKLCTNSKTKLFFFKKMQNENFFLF